MNKLITLFVVSFVILESFSFVDCGVLFEYAGTTTGAHVFAPADLSSGGCTGTSIYAPYVVFNVTFSSAGVREVAAIVDDSLRSSISVFVYAKFNPAMPCNDLVGQIQLNQFELGGGPILDDFLYFNSSQMYFFVVTSSENNISGVFAVNIFESDATGATTDLSPTWPLVFSTTFYTPDCSSQGGDAPYATYTWTQPTTSFFDLSAFFVNDSGWGSTNLALFQGNFLNPDLIKDPCDETSIGAKFVSASYSDARGTIIPYQNLAEGENYSVVLSGDSLDTYGFWGFQITPTRTRFEITTSQYIQPSRSLPCALGNFAVPAWDSIYFVATQRTYLIDTGVPPEPYERFDTYSFLYQGNNTRNGNNSTPASCSVLTPLLAFNDTGSNAIVQYLEPGGNYTIVVSTFDTSGLLPLNPPQEYAYMLYIFTGEPLGNIPPINPPTPTPTHAPPTSSTTGNTSTVTSSTSSTTSSANRNQPFGLFFILSLFVLHIFAH